RRHTRSKRDWSSDVCSSDLKSSSIYIANSSSFNACTLRSAAVDSLVVNKSLLIFSKYFSSGSILIPIICDFVLIFFIYLLVIFDGIEFLFLFFSYYIHFSMLLYF